MKEAENGLEKLVLRKIGIIILVCLETRKGKLWEYDICPVTRRAMVNFFHFKQSMLIWLGKNT